MDMSQFTAPKSDQINSDDFIAGPRTITITKVTANEGNREQPINVFFEGDEEKPYRPCLSMRRAMMAIWGVYTDVYVGRSMTLYRDPEVTWGGMAVGGIRISNMSHMDGPMTLALTATKKARKPYKVLPLVIEQKAPEPAEPDKATTAANALAARFAAVVTAQDYYSILDDEKTAPQMQWLKEKRPALFADVDAARAAAADRMDEAPAAVAADGEMPG